MRLPIINLAQDALSRFDEVIQKEWLLTNGLGSYASSTVLGINTRKYHGLLIAALRPPGDRTVCLSKIDEEVRVSNTTIQLGSNDFNGTIFPRGYQFLKEFSVSPFPNYVYKADGFTIGKAVFMPHQINAVVVVYNVLNRSIADITMNAFPLLTCRYFHSVVDRRSNPLDFKQTQNDGEVELSFNNPKACITTRAIKGRFNESPNWIDKLYYREEECRGESHTDDCYQPGYFEFCVPKRRNGRFAVVTAVGDNSQETAAILNGLGATIDDLESLLERELNSRNAFLTKFYGLHKAVTVSDWLSWVLLATDTFIVKNASERRSVIAGYFWFEPWGRDTFISLPGLMLVTERFEDARKILSNFKGYCKQGLIPNFIEDSSGEPAYNTVDATLWYMNAVLQFLKYTGDFDFVRKTLWETLKSIIENHKKGTAFGIHVDNDGLLAHGPRLTWMDAEVDFKAITPRVGKAVEIQALWYNALKTTQLLATKFEEGRLAEEYAIMAEDASTGFNKKFWNHEKNCLYDAVTEFGADPSLRPNQIIAVALDFTMLDNDKSNQIVDLINDKLVTQCGLRTLACTDPLYKGSYVGGRQSRDQAYHNGTVWPWLTGPFTKAFFKAKGHSERTQEFALKNFLLPLFNKQVTQAGLGTLSEIYDGDPPHTPRGCIAQAWSVAEPLRAYVEDAIGVKPKHEKGVLASLNLRGFL
jgi:predicted glycogen debranching enzyme